MSSRIGKWL